MAKEIITRITSEDGSVLAELVENGKTSQLHLWDGQHGKDDPIVIDAVSWDRFKQAVKAGETLAVEKWPKAPPAPSPSPDRRRVYGTDVPGARIVKRGKLKKHVRITQMQLALLLQLAKLGRSEYHRPPALYSDMSPAWRVNDLLYSLVRRGLVEYSGSYRKWAYRPTLKGLEVARELQGHAQSGS